MSVWKPTVCRTTISFVYFNVCIYPFAYKNCRPPKSLNNCFARKRLSGRNKLAQSRPYIKWGQESSVKEILLAKKLPWKRFYGARYFKSNEHNEYIYILIVLECSNLWSYIVQLHILLTRRNLLLPQQNIYTCVFIHHLIH